MSLTTSLLTFCDFRFPSSFFTPLFTHAYSDVYLPTQPENILLHSPGPYPRIQIADFGLARPRAWEETLHVCGTISYLPPEGVRALENKNLGYVGMPADCWSAGIVIFAMLTCAFSLLSHSTFFIGPISLTLDLPRCLPGTDT